MERAEEKEDEEEEEKGRQRIDRSDLSAARQPGGRLSLCWLPLSGPADTSPPLLPLVVVASDWGRRGGWWAVGGGGGAVGRLVGGDGGGWLFVCWLARVGSLRFYYSLLRSKRDISENQQGTIAPMQVPLLNRVRM